MAPDDLMVYTGTAIVPAVASPACVLALRAVYVKSISVLTSCIVLIVTVLNGMVLSFAFVSHFGDLLHGDGALAIVAALPAASDAFELSCATIRSDTTRADLVARFGAANVVDADVYVGEGYYEPATVLFGETPERRAEILWQTAATRTRPRLLRISGQRSRWKTPEGLTVGLDLAAVERLNQRAFRLSGFGWDYGGTTISWSGGVIARSELPPCTTWARFATSDSALTAEERQLVGQVQRDESFSSGHPGMRAAHARVVQFGLAWRP